MWENGAGSPRLEVAMDGERARENLPGCCSGGVPVAEALEDAVCCDTKADSLTPKDFSLRTTDAADAKNGGRVAAPGSSPPRVKHSPAATPLAY